MHKLDITLNSKFYLYAIDQKDFWMTIILIRAKITIICLDYIVKICKYSLFLYIISFSI